MGGISREMLVASTQPSPSPSPLPSLCPVTPSGRRALMGQVRKETRRKNDTTISWLWGEAVHGMRKLWCPNSQSCNLGRAAENYGEELVVSLFTGGFPQNAWLVIVLPIGPWDHVHLAQLFYRWVCPEYMTGNRDTTVSSCRGHGLPAHHHSRRPCPDYMTGYGGTTVSSFRGRSPPEVTKL